MNRAFLAGLVYIYLIANGAYVEGSRQLHQEVVSSDSGRPTNNANSLSSLIQTAIPGSTLVLDASTIILTETVQIKVANITIQGSSSEQRPTIQCSAENPAARIEIDANGIDLHDIIIENCNGPAVRILNSVVVDNEPLKSGPNVVNIRNVDFRNNLQPAETSFDPSLDGGALQVGAGTEVRITNCQFSNNAGVVGGAIRVFGASILEIFNSIFTENEARISGGAIFVGALQQISGLRSKFTVSACTFLRNKDLTGGQDTSGLRLANGAPLETNEVLRFLTPQSSAGAIFMSRFDRVTISDSLFEGNTAISAGGALFIADNRKVEIKSNKFVNNSATSLSNGYNRPDLAQGGALYIAFSNERSRITIENCSFMRNHAAYGGAIHLVGTLTTKASITSCDFHKNVALLGGGGILVRNIVQVTMRSLRFRNNLARVGGGMMVANGGGVVIFEGVLDSLDTIFSENEALDGGGCYFLASGAVLGQAVIFDLNKAARHGGGIAMIESTFGGSVTFQDSKFSGNSAQLGGAIYQDSTFAFSLTKTTKGTAFISGNRALAGGGVYLQPWSQVKNEVTCQGIVINNNTALSNIADLPQLTRAFPMVDFSNINDGSFFHERPVQNYACLPGGGGGVCLSLVPLLPRASLSITFRDCSIVTNNAVNGGGILISKATQKTCVDECPVQENVATTITVCPDMHFEEVFFNNNMASAGGLSLVLLESSKVKWSC